MADVAVEYLKQTPQGQQTLQEVEALLQGEAPGQAARWADDIKEIDEAKLVELPDGDARATFLFKVQDYYTDHPDQAVGEAKDRPLMGHKLWHYTDVPFQLPEYRLGETGTRPDDVVQMLGHCIRILRDGTSPGAPIALTRPEALRLLLHYVGDIHQPLHVGSAYVTGHGPFRFAVPADDANDADNADDATPIPDRGGNALLSGAQSMHSFWDGTAPDTARGKRSFSDYAADLVTAFPALENKPTQPLAPEAGQVRPATREWQTPGDVTLWPKEWADDSLAVARQAYEGIVVDDVASNADDPEKIKWDVTPPADYVQTSSDLARVQLAKAGYHLAQLLQVLFP